MYGLRNTDFTEMNIVFNQFPEIENLFYLEAWQKATIKMAQMLIYV